MDGDVSDDGYWQLQNGEWVPTEKQVEALQGGATPHNEVSQQQPPQMVNLGMTAQPMTIMMPQKEKSPLVMVLIIVGAIVGLIILSGILYAWASSLAVQNDAELEGTWTNPVDRIQFSSNGDVSESTETFEGWRTQDDLLIFFDTEYEYHFQYKITNELLFLAPIDEDDQLQGDLCIAYLKGETGSDNSTYEERIEAAERQNQIPSWCTPEE